MPAVIFDMDGVIYRGDQTMHGAPACVSDLRAHGFKIGFLTNNSCRSRESIRDNLHNHGISSSINEIMTSGEATVRYMLREGHTSGRVFVIGGHGLIETLEKAGFETDIADEGLPCDFVVVGWDREFNYQKLCRAQWEIMEHDAEFIATNADNMYPGEDRFFPGAGTMVAAVETATSKKAPVIGKPSEISLEFLLRDIRVENESPENIWMVGDRLDTDIACGKALGIRTIIITTGVTTREEAESSHASLRPDHIIDSLDEINDLVL